MGTLYVVATPIGNLSDISIRAIETLKNVDLIAVEDTRQTIKLLNHFDIKTKMVAYHKFNEISKSNNLIEKLKSGLNVALVSDAGTPCISDPGYILVKLAKEEKINVIGISGPSAVITALSIAGIDTSKFTFIGFLPTDNTKLKKEVELIHNSNINTFVFYESPRRLLKLVKLLSVEFPNSIISICSDLTKLHERNFYGNIEDVLEIISNDSKIEKGEYTIVFEKNEEFKEDVLDNSIESLLVDIIVKNKCSLKEAVNILNNENKKISKKDIYSASLNLKNLLR